MLPSTLRRIEHRLRQVERSCLPAAERAALPPEAAPPDDPLATLDQAVALLEEPVPRALASRIAALRGLIKGSGEGAALRAYAAGHGFLGVRRFDTEKSRRLYRLQVETLPRHVNNLHLILGGSSTILHDAGSFLDSTVRDLRLGFAAVRAGWGESVRLESVDDIVVSHSHLDHFGGCAWFKRHSAARIHVHELDLRVLVDFDERIAFASKALEIFFERAGLEPDECRELLDLYVSTKALVESCSVDRVLRDGDSIDGCIEVIHTPGHCPGQICLLIGDHLLTADHVLPDITPHLGPELITPHTGVTHYIEALHKIGTLPGVRRALPGHGEPIEDFPGRVAEILRHHRRRLEKVLEICREGATIREVSLGLFGKRTSYHRILAVQEAGAHVEHLQMIGRLRIANLEEIEERGSVPYRYVVRESIPSRAG